MIKQAYFPMFVSLEEKKIVVIGGGKIASRRIKTLVEFVNDIVVIAPRIHGSIPILQKKGFLRFEQRAFLENDVEGAYFVIAATDNQEVNDQVYEVCKKRGILVNHAGDQSKCDFFFPGIVKKEQVVIGVTSSGSNHKLAKKVTDFMEQCLMQ